MYDWIRKIKEFVWRLFGRKPGKAVWGPIPFPDSPYLERIRAETTDKSLKIASRRHPDIRIAVVDGFTDAYRHLLRICDQRQLSRRYGAGHYYYTVTLPENSGQLVLTDNVGFRKDGAIAVLHIKVANAMLPIKEIRYKQTL